MESNAGLKGSAGYVGLGSGHKLRGKGFQGDRLVVLTPGGGGIGDPKARAPERVARDLSDEFVSARAAREVYGYAPPEAAE